jgi:hypothetical protein
MGYNGDIVGFHGGMADNEHRDFTLKSNDITGFHRYLPGPVIYQI